MKKEAVKKTEPKAAKKNIFSVKPEGSKFIVRLNDGVVHRAGSMSAAQETLRKRTKDLDPNSYEIRLDPELKVETVLSGVVAAPEASPFTVEQRFHYLSTMTKLVAIRHAQALIVLGLGGLGKTWTIRKSLEAAKLRDLVDVYDQVEVGGVVPQHLRKKTYVHVKGFSTAKALYRHLHDHNDMITVFDDCDDIQSNKVAVDIMKGALDSLPRRRIYWNAEEPPGTSADKQLPRAFDFTGGVIFISNMDAHKLNQAFQTRALRADVQMTRAEIVQRMHWIIDTAGDEFLPNIPMPEKREALVHLESIAEEIPMERFQLRALINACQLRSSGEPEWKEMTTYSLTSK